MMTAFQSFRTFAIPAIATVCFGATAALAADSELTNYKSGIDVTWGGVKGTDYYEEYFFHDKLVDDHKVVYIRSTTPITMAHNSRNIAQYPSPASQSIGANGVDGLAGSGDEGIIRYKLDRDRQYYYKWADNFARTETARVLPAYSSPFTLASLTYETGVPVVGTTGWNVGANPTGPQFADRANTYYRGVVDDFGDEWHTLAYADDDNVFLRAVSTTFVDQAFYASDGKTVLLVVNPKTPCLSPRATGTGQFYTTVPKAYWTPKVVTQTTYFSEGTSGTVTFEIRDINGNNVHYKINGGAVVDVTGSTVTLNASQFNVGSNTLEYFFDSGVHKTRTIVKNPTFPSAAEAHGNYLWQDTAGYNKTTSRLAREPYKSYYLGYRNRGDFSGQDEWDANSHLGLRYSSNAALKNAFVAKVEGATFARSSKTHLQYAREMVLENLRAMDPIGFELQHSSDAVPNRELHYRGYYDSLPVLDTLFAYDILVANFRSDQVTGGITAVEDYFVRDHLAMFAFEAMQWSAGMQPLGAPGMWGGARMMAATDIGMILREYSSPYYGTSGFGTVQTTYPLTPYQTDQLTWKAALFDGATAPRTAFPNFTWSVGLSDNGADSLFTPDETLSGVHFEEGQWRDKVSYVSGGLMGIHLMIWANMSKIWENHTNPRLELAIGYATAGTLRGQKVETGVTLSTQTPGRFAMLLLLNSRWKTPAADNALNWVQTLPASDGNSDDKSMQDAGVFGFAWYDDQVLPPGGPTSLRLAP